MAATKKKSSSASEPSALAGLASWLFGPGRALLVSIAVVAIIAGGAWLAWWRFEDRIAAENRVNPSSVYITPQPSYILQTDVRAEVFHNPTIDGPLSLTDPDLVDRIAKAFARHPWVAKVNRVVKQPGGVKVDLTYRKPACMVQVPGGDYQPVDAEGVLLPSADFTSQDVPRYPVLLYVDRGPAISPGSRWPDTRVIGGAAIAGLLADVWTPMRLRYIEPWAAYPPPSGQPPADAIAMPSRVAGQSIEPIFTLVAQSKTRITWGYAPNANTLGEPTAAEKVAWLKHYFSTHDDSFDGPGGAPQELDVRKPLPSMRK